MAFHQQGKRAKLPLSFEQARDLKANTAIITGAAGALGASLTLRYAQEGTTVVMCDKEARQLERLYDKVVAQGYAEPIIHPLDLAVVSPDQASELIDTVVSELGGIDLLLHCAARFNGLTPLEQFPSDEWLLHMQTNLNAAWLLSSVSLPALRESALGQLVFMLEDLERVGKPNWGAYGVSKHALASMVKQWVSEVGRSEVTVLGINPGPFRSPLRAEAYLAEDPAALRDPEDVAASVFELLQNEELGSSALIDLHDS